MALRLPTSTQWISFPTSPQSSALITWTDDMHAKSATYYVTKCYWGNLAPENVPEKPAVPVQTGVEQKKTVAKPVTAKGSVDEILGETRLFIAAEYTERQYHGGPMKDFHIQDLAGRTEDDERDSWVTMQLNDCFHYGQNGSGSSLNRFVVYHPPIAPTFRAPRMFQHRFTGLISAELAKAASEQLQELAPEGYHVAAVAGSKLAGYAVEVVKGISGHPLHQYLGVAGVKRAEERQNKVDWKKVNIASELSDESKRILVLQISEGLKDKEENALSDKEQPKREENARANLKILISQMEKTSDTIKKTSSGIGKNPIEQASKTMGLSEAVVIGSRDGDAAVLDSLVKTMGSVAGLSTADIISSTTPADNKNKTSSTKDSVVDKATSKPPNADPEKPSRPDEELHILDLEHLSPPTDKVHSWAPRTIRPSRVDANVAEKVALKKLSINSPLARNLHQVRDSKALPLVLQNNVSPGKPFNTPNQGHR